MKNKIVLLFPAGPIFLLLGVLIGPFTPNNIGVWIFCLLGMACGLAILVLALANKIVLRTK